MGGGSKKHGGKNSGEGGEASEAAVETTNKLPKANVVRLMKGVLPRNVQVGDSAKKLTKDCAVEFVGYVSGEAAERARLEHRRTIVPDNFTWSLEDIGFDSYVDPMQTYIQGRREYNDRARGGRSSGLPPPRHVPSSPVDTLSPDMPVTVTDEELEFLRSVVPPPPGGY